MPPSSTPWTVIVLLALGFSAHGYAPAPALSSRFHRALVQRSCGESGGLFIPGSKRDEGPKGGLVIPGHEDYDIDPVEGEVAPLPEKEVSRARGRDS